MATLFPDRPLRLVGEDGVADVVGHDASVNPDLSVVEEDAAVNRFRRSTRAPAGRYSKSSMVRHPHRETGSMAGGRSVQLLPKKFYRAVEGGVTSVHPEAGQTGGTAVIVLAAVLARQHWRNSRVSLGPQTGKTHGNDGDQVVQTAIWFP